MHRGADLEKAKVDSTVARRRYAELGNAKVDWKVAVIEVQSWTNPKWMAINQEGEAPEFKGCSSQMEGIDITCSVEI